jgi:hypothetical protein
VNSQFLAEADLEFREAAKYYEKQATGLGLVFITEVHKAAELLGEQPELGVLIEQCLRKFSLKRFPYDLIYVIDEWNLLIVAVAHHKRRPYFWALRV